MLHRLGAGFGVLGLAGVLADERVLGDRGLGSAALGDRFTSGSQGAPTSLPGPST